MANGGTVEELAEQLLALRDAQRAHQAAALAADDLELDAMAAEQLAKDAQTTAHRLGAEARAAYHDYAVLINQVLDDQPVIPPQRPAP